MILSGVNTGTGDEATGLAVVVDLVELDALVLFTGAGAGILILCPGRSVAFFGKPLAAQRAVSVTFSRFAIESSVSLAPTT